MDQKTKHRTNNGNFLSHDQPERLSSPPHEGRQTGKGRRRRGTTLHEIRKYLNYFFETRGFTTDVEPGASAPQVVAAAAVARGAERGPAVIIQGIMPRSGTVYVGELLRRHPDLYAYPNHIWEFPALQMTGHLHRLQEEFLRAYRGNQGRLEAEDFLPLFGAGLLAYLHNMAPEGQRLLLKMPSVQYLNHFSAMFPHEHLLVLLRDGRDVVHSTLRTWKSLNFVQVCLRWNRSARIVLDNARRMEGQPGYLLARYEDALEEPHTFIETACRHFGLDPDCYPFEKLAEIRVIGSSKLEKGNVTWRHLKSPENFSPTGYWRKWSPLRKLIFKAIAGRSLLALGYSQDLNW